jgi:phage-related protein
MDEEGNAPVKDFILGQPDGAIAEILHVFKLLRQFNITLGMPYVRKINRSGIRELRIKHGSDIYRIFFFAHTGQRFILLHAILKKENKISESDRNLAIQRMNNYKSRH